MEGIYKKVYIYNMKKYKTQIIITLILAFFIISLNAINIFIS